MIKKPHSKSTDVIWEVEKKKLPVFWFKKTFKVGQTAFSGNQGSCQSLAPNIDTLLGPNLTPVDPLGANFDDLYN